MGGKATGEARQTLLVMLLASLTTLLVPIPALAAQAPSGGQRESAQGGPSGGVSGVCEHAPGEFLVGYVSEEALQAAPTENVVETFAGILAQHLVYDEIKNDPDPTSRLAAEEAKKQELEARPGVAYVEYNCLAQAAAAEASPPPASCSDCGRYAVERARKIIAKGFDGTDKDAFNAALEAAQSADDNVVFASRVEANAEAPADDSTDGDGAEAQPEEAGSGAGEENANTESDAEEAYKVSSGDAEAEGEDAGAESGAGPISGRNAAASGVRSAGDPPVLALGAGVLLLVAGILAARRTLRG